MTSEDFQWCFLQWLGSSSRADMAEAALHFTEILSISSFEHKNSIKSFLKGKILQNFKKILLQT